MHHGALLIVIEGLDGSGKTSASKELFSMLDAVHQGHIKSTFEPNDASCAGPYIREILTKKVTDFDPHVLPLAFATNRLDHCHNLIKPWLSAHCDNIVLCDRYYLSSLVYQSTPDFSFDDVMALNQFALRPDIIFFINVDNKTCRERMAKRNQPEELFETNLTETRAKYIRAIEYLQKKENAYIVEIDGSGTITEVAEAIKNKIFEFAPHRVKGNDEEGRQ
jgi:dTMP kinase